MTLQLGCGQRDITPAACRTTLYGTAARPVEIVDPLYVRAVALRLDGTSVLVLSYDLIGVTGPFTAAIRSTLAAQLSLDRDAIVLAASHTHTAPLTMYFKYCPKPDAEYLGWLRQQSLEAARQAMDDLTDVEYGFGQGSCPCNINRIERGRIVEVNDIHAAPGLVDDTLGVLALRRPGGAIKAIVWNYACHPLTMCRVRPTNADGQTPAAASHRRDDTGSNVISADYPGAVARELALHYPGALPVFLQGCAGNMNPRIHGGVGARDQLGARLAAAIAAIVTGLKWSQARVLGVRSVTGRLATLGGLVAAPLQGLTLDDVGAVFLPGEQFAETGLELRRRLGPRRIIAAYCNKVEVGYVPTRRYLTDFPHEYECEKSCVVYQMSKVAVSGAEELLEQCVQLAVQGGDTVLGSTAGFSKEKHSCAMIPHVG